MCTYMNVSSRSPSWQLSCLKIAVVVMKVVAVKVVVAKVVVR